MRIYESVFEISEKFLDDKSPVNVIDSVVDLTAEQMSQKGVTKFPTKEITKDHIYQAVIQEFVGCAINYCYWYGLSHIRPNMSSSTRMYALVETAFHDYQNGDNFEICIQRLIEYLAINRFPMLEEREKHLKELIPDGEDFCYGIANSIFYKDKEDFYPFFVDMIKTFPGYASDIFLKRASLFFLQMYRQYGWFESAMFELPVPADYQVPKMLKGFNILNYDTYLYELIKNEVLLPKGSREECSIRAATVIACKKLQQKTGWNIADIDGYFWLKRKEVDDPFHLCITTDY
jgi:hypothetical protein